MFYGIMWFDARALRQVPADRAGRGGGGEGRGQAAGGAPTCARLAGPGPGRARGMGAGRGARGARHGRSAGEARAGRGLGSLAELWRSTARPVQWRRAAPDKGSAFLKRRRPLQAAAGMAARPERAGGADGGRGGPSCGPLGVPEGPAARKGFVHRPGNARCASAWPTPFLASVNPGGQQIPLPSNPLLG